MNRHWRGRNGAGVALRRVSPRGIFRGGAAAALACLCLWSASGCAPTPLSQRYRAERDFWKAASMERRQTLRDGKAAGSAKVADAYAAILRKYPISSAQGNRGEAQILARVRAAAASSLARLDLKEGRREEAIKVLWDRRLEYPEDTESTLHTYGDLIPLLARPSSADSLLALYREVVARLPAGTPEGRPVALVMEAPLQMADLLTRLGRQDEARGALTDAGQRFEQIAREHPGTPLQVAALLQEANTRIRQGRPQEAVSLLEHARELPQASSYDGGILFSLAVVHEQGLKDPEGAIAIFRRLVQEHPDDPAAPQAQLRMGIAFSEAGMADSAQAAFARTEAAYSKQVDVSAQARFLSAQMLARQGDGADAIRRFRSVTADYPRTEVGLRAPLEIANYYRDTGQKQPEQAALRDAASEYERIIQDLSGSPGQAGPVLTALDRLAEARVRLSDWPGAVEALRKRAEDFPADAGSPMALLQAAAIEEARLGDRSGTLALLQRVLDRYPQHPLAAKIRDKIAKLEAGS